MVNGICNLPPVSNRRLIDGSNRGRRLLPTPGEETHKQRQPFRLQVAHSCQSLYNASVPDTRFSHKRFSDPT